ncbi:MAG: nucleotidyltransferase family protein, partial [Synergistaceae bacterium]|nr:nucleotidyltransferase family protein [Synergistaceae bacterium]
MSVIGIAAEYNPFHNGHALHIARARSLLNDAPSGNAPGGDIPVAAVLSSGFTQRGLPALADKWARARMALLNGADLVLELPFAWACNGGREFARGAVDILAGTGFVTHLSFGAETPAAFESRAAETILHILIPEPPSFKLRLRENLASGWAYPRAFADALDRELPGSGKTFSLPNNALAFSYLLRVREGRYGLIPLPVGREGPGHAEGGRALEGAMPPRGAEPPLASAATIREAIAKGNGRWDEGIGRTMPASSRSGLEEERERGRLCVGTERLWTLVRALLARSS